MAGNMSGGLNAKETRIRNLMSDRGIPRDLAESIYRYEMSMRGKLGGTKSRGGGFANGETGRELARTAGSKGGKASKRK